ncbi:MAG: DUF1016 N-terminal domain-containing protein [Candidatus Zapsychrus exili]|nr:DUF1016 N-terminal domain-containing protein [Candidatus Zapsychrus exili]
MQNIIISKSYDNLFLRIKNAFSLGLVKAEKALEYQRIKTYWQVGREINKAACAPGSELCLGQMLYEKISADLKQQINLDISPDTVSRTVRFSKDYPKCPKKTHLTFTHYLALQRIKDPKLRLKFERDAISKNMKVEDLKNAVYKITNRANPNREQSQLVVERGEPFVYSVYVDSNVKGKDTFRIDCGFRINKHLHKQTFKIDQKLTICSIKEGDKYRTHIYKSGAHKLYTYPAKITKIIDADTVDAQIDVGFSIGLNERLRFKGIDAPEITTQAGKVAKKFLVDYLVKCPIVVIRTKTKGNYGRWISDVFALKGCSDPYEIASKGECINQLLIRNNLAKIYKG